MPDKRLTGELELIDRACAGSVDAFEKIVLHYQDRLYRFLLARAGNRSDAEDALQETFVAAFKYLSSYRRKYEFSTWLFTIAIRQLASLKGKQTPTSETFPETIGNAEPGPETLGIQRQLSHSLWKTARQSLNESQFTALWLFYVEEMSLVDIGKTLGRPSTWVKVNLMRARRRLSRELESGAIETSIPIRELTT